MVKKKTAAVVAVLVVAKSVQNVKNWIFFSFSLSFIFVPLQAIIMAPPNHLQSPAQCSLTWWTRFCLTRSLTRRFSANAPRLSAKWIERTAQLLRKRRRMRGHPLSMGSQVRLGMCAFNKIEWVNIGSENVWRCRIVMYCIFGLVYIIWKRIKKSILYKWVQMQLSRVERLEINLQRHCQ